MEKKLVRTHQDPEVYQMAFKVAMQIFELSIALDNIIGKIVILINNPQQWLLPGAKRR